MSFGAPTAVILASFAVSCVDGLVTGAPRLRGARKAMPANVPVCSFATTVAPFVGAGLANGMFFSGLPEVLEKRKEGNLGDFNPLPMPVILGNTVGWTAYSMLAHDPFVAAANAPGLVLSAWYVLTTSRLANAATARQIERTTLAMAIIHTAASLACAFVLPTRAAMISMYGIICNGILLMYYGAPLSSIKTVLQSRSAASIYFPTVLLNGINAVFWSVYALAIRDKYLLVPNAIGASLCAIQAFLCFAFGKFTRNSADLLEEDMEETDVASREPELSTN